MIVFDDGVGNTVRGSIGAIGWKESDTDLLLLNAALGGLLDVGPDLGDVANIAGGADCNRLNEEFVPAPRVWWWVLLHRLQQHLHFHALARLDATGVGAYAVP